MGVFIDAQDKCGISICPVYLMSSNITHRALADMLASHRGAKAGKTQPRSSMETSSTSSEPNTDTGSSPVAVLPSSTELFYFYRQSLEQCAKLSTGKALFDLCTLHKKWLRIYAGKFLIHSKIAALTPIRVSPKRRRPIS
jgi:vacuolar protein sorting-associated protein 53